MNEMKSVYNKEHHHIASHIYFQPHRKENDREILQFENVFRLYLYCLNSINPPKSM